MKDARRGIRRSGGQGPARCAGSNTVPLARGRDVVLLGRVFDEGGPLVWVVASLVCFHFLEPGALELSRARPAFSRRYSRPLI